MPAVHDRGGWPDAGPIDTTAHHELSDWERHTDALMLVLSSDAKRVMTVDELRRAIETLPKEQYETLLYYERWASAIELLVTEKGILTRDEIDHRAASL